MVTEFDGTQTNLIYESLSWVGLKGSGIINANTGLPTNPTVAWANVPLSQRLLLNNTYSNFKSSNPPCQ